MPSWVGDRKQVKSTGNFSHYYRCGNKNTRKTSYPCTVLPLPADKIEQYIVDYVKNLLSDPKATFDFQKNLRSNQLELNRLRGRRDFVRTKLNDIPNLIGRIKEQHEHGLLETRDMLEKIKKAENDRLELEKELKHLDLQIGKKANLEAYEKSLALFSKKYIKQLDDVYTNREKVFEILHMLIDGVVVHARRLGKSEKVPGQPKMKTTEVTADKATPDQMVPFEMDIYLKLPQQIMVNMARKHILFEDDLIEFRVKPANLWVRRDSNPRHPA